MQEQYQDFILSKAQQPSAPVEPPSGVGTVVVSPGPGLTRVIESLGANAVVSGGQTMNPSTEDILSAVESIASQDVIVLPNNKNIVMAAEQAQALSDKSVRVVRTVTVPQGISALLALNYQADLETNVRVMEEAAQAIETVEVTTAVRSVTIDDMDVEEGEIIGLLNGKLKIKDLTPAATTLSALHAIGGEDYEIITIYYGESVAPDEAQELAETIEQEFPEQEVEVVDGGQPHYYYIISAE